MPYVYQSDYKINAETTYQKLHDNKIKQNDVKVFNFNLLDFKNSFKMKISSQQRLSSNLDQIIKNLIWKNSSISSPSNPKNAFTPNSPSTSSLPTINIYSIGAITKPVWFTPLRPTKTPWMAIKSKKAPGTKIPISRNLAAKPKSKKKCLKKTKFK